VFGQRRSHPVAGRLQPRPRVPGGQPPREQVLGPLADERGAVACPEDVVGARLPDAFLALRQQALVTRQQVGFQHRVPDRERVVAEDVRAVDHDGNGEPLELDIVATESAPRRGTNSHTTDPPILRRRSRAACATGRSASTTRCFSPPNCPQYRGSRATGRSTAQMSSRAMVRRCISSVPSKMRRTRVPR
jgi:hypothetical protein